MRLMDDEKVVIETDGNFLVLTTYRVRYDAESIGAGELASIMLEQVASCSLVRKTQPLLGVFAAISLIASLFLLNQGHNLYVGPLLATVVATVMYYITAKKVLEISSAGGKAIFANVGGMEKKKIVELIDEIELCKRQRLDALKGRLAL